MNQIQQFIASHSNLKVQLWYQYFTIKDGAFYAIKIISNADSIVSSQEFLLQAIAQQVQETTKRQQQQNQNSLDGIRYFLSKFSQFYHKIIEFELIIQNQNCFDSQYLGVKVNLEYYFKLLSKFSSLSINIMLEMSGNQKLQRIKNDLLQIKNAITLIKFNINEESKSIIDIFSLIPNLSNKIKGLQISTKYIDSLSLLQIQYYCSKLENVTHLAYNFESLCTDSLQLDTYSLLNNNKQHTLEILELNVKENILTPLDHLQIQKMIAYQSNLKKINLNFESTFLNDEQISKLLLSMLKSKQTLKNITLKLKNNQIAHEGNLQLGNFISNISQKLENIDLDLTNNYLRDENLSYIADGLRKLSKAESIYLSLSKNYIKYQGALTICSSISQLVKLRELTLDLSSNILDMKTIIQCLEMLRSLKQLDILKLNFESNSITFPGVLNIFKAISQIINLKFLDLRLGYNRTFKAETYRVSTMGIPIDLPPMKKESIEFKKLLKENIFSNLKNLKSFNLCLKNQTLDQDETNYIYQEILNLASLNQLSLDLSNTTNEEQDYTSLEQLVSQKPILEAFSLALNENRIKNHDFSNITNILQQNSDLKYSNFSLQCIKSLFQLKWDSKQIQNLEFEKFKKHSFLTLLDNGKGEKEPIRKILNDQTYLDSLDLELRVQHKENFQIHKVVSPIIQNLSIDFYNYGTFKRLNVKPLSDFLSSLENLKHFKLKILNDDSLNLTIKPLGKSLSKMHNLQGFSLKNESLINSIKIGGLKYLCQGMQGLNSLRTLQLHYSFKLMLNSGFCLKKAFMSLSNLIHLEIDLNRASYDQCGVILLGDCLSCLPKLEKLYINPNFHRFCDYGLKYFCNGISSLSHLRCLDLKLAGCTITSYGYQFLQSGLRFKNKLQDLTLDIEKAPNFKPKYGIYLGQAISEAGNLLNLNINLSNCSIMYDGIVDLSFALSKLRYLRSLSLDLMKNELTDKAMGQLKKYLPKISTLKELTLKLEQNKIEANGAKEIGECLSKLRNLQTLALYVCHNKIQDEGVEYLMSELSNLSYLTSLYLKLQAIKITPKAVGITGNNIIKIKSLTTLNIDFQMNQLTKEVAQEIQNKVSSSLNLVQFTLRFLNPSGSYK